MKILVVSSYLPYPLHSGGDVRLYNLLSRLSKKHTVTLVCEVRDFQKKSHIEELKKICHEVIPFQRKKQWSFGNVLKSGISTEAFLITGHTLPQMRSAIAELLRKEAYDLIHCETSYVMQNIPTTHIPIVLTEHNIEYQVYERYAKTKPFPLSELLMVDVQKLKRKEESFWKKASKVIVVSNAEAEVVKKTGVTASIVPNGVDIGVFKKKPASLAFEKKEKRILFIGDYKWIQNQHAVRWILSDIWPRIEKVTDENVKLWLVGRNMPEDVKNSSSKRIIAEGESHLPTQEIFSESFALLAPLKVSAGTQYKILESMAVGTPVVTTPHAVVGFSTLNEKQKEVALLSDDSGGLAGKIAYLLDKKDVYQEVADTARSYVEENYSFDSIAEMLDEVYNSVKGKK